MNANQINFHCSGLDKLMSEPRSNSTGILSEQCKAELFACYIENRYGRSARPRSKYLAKSALVYTEAEQLYTAHRKVQLKHNDFIIENKYIKGSPRLFMGEDIIHAHEVVLLKCSWDIFSFFRNRTAKLNPRHYWQLQGYMALTGARQGRVVYCLVNTPAPLVEQEKRSLLSAMDLNHDAARRCLRACKELEHSLCFNDIPPHERIGEITVHRSDDNIERLYRRITDCRRFMNEHLFAGSEVVR